jgi:hypothetical protein
MPIMNFLRKSLGIALVLLSLCLPAYADEAATLRQINDLMKQMNEMKDQMVRMQGTIESQNTVIRQLEKKVGPEVRTISPGAGNQAEFNEQLKGSIGDASKWLKGLKFSGDIKLRYEAQEHTKGSGQRDRNRFRFRLRFGFEKTFSEEAKVGFRIATGSRTYNSSTPSPHNNDTLGPITTTNQTMENNFDLKAANIERVYASYFPKWLKTGPIQSAEFTAGKFGNPFEEGSTMMIWDRDVTPEGVYEKFTGQIYKNERLDLKGTVLGGQMVLQEGSTSGNDAQLFAVQGGFKPKLTLDGWQKPIEAKNLVSYYGFNGITHYGDYTSAGWNPLSGNDLAAGDFKVIEVYNEVSTEFPSAWRVPKLTLYHDWAQNVADNALLKSRGRGQDMAWSLGAKLGELKNKGSWEASYEYYWIEANSTVSNFVDNDLGGTNRQGTVLRCSYAFTDYMNVGTSVFLIDRLLQSDLNWGTNQSRNTYQVDLNYKF